MRLPSDILTKKYTEYSDDSSSGMFARRPWPCRRIPRRLAVGPGGDVTSHGLHRTTVHATEQHVCPWAGTGLTILILTINQPFTAPPVSVSESSSGHSWVRGHERWL